MAVQVHNSISNISLVILNELENKFPEVMFAIIGDSPFSSCCTDYMSALHIQASGILHFGHSCNTNSIIPVLHFPEPLGPSYDLLQMNLLNIGEKVYVTGSSEQVIAQATQILKDNQKTIVQERTSANSLLYVGTGCCPSSLIESPEQNVLILSTNGFENYNSYDFISKRYHFISQVPDCQVFGILISSLSIYNQISSFLKSLLNNYQKTYYPIYLGKITPLKLGNFREIDMFVMVSCINTPLPDNKNFYKPVITPFELEVGLKGNWEGKYSTKFQGEALSNKPHINDSSYQFSQRDFKGLTPGIQGSIHVEEGYSGIASIYESEFK